MTKIEIRGDSVVIDGYVNVVERESRPLKSGDGFFIEKIRKGAFQRALSKATNVDILLNHKKPLGSTASNLKLKEDVIGLRAIATITDQDVIEKAKQKRLRGWSFGFFCEKDSRKKREDGIELRTVEELSLDEVSIIDDSMMPCYESTTIEMRAGEAEKEKEFRAEEFEAEYSKLEEKNKSYDNSKLKERIEKLGGKVNENI